MRMIIIGRLFFFNLGNFFSYYILKNNELFQCSHGNLPFQLLEAECVSIFSLVACIWSLAMSLWQKVCFPFINTTVLVACAMCTFQQMSLTFNSKQSLEQEQAMFSGMIT